MYFITFKEGGILEPVFDNRNSQEIVEDLKRLFKTFIVEFDIGIRYDTILGQDGSSPWCTQPSIEEKIKKFDMLLEQWNNQPQE